MNVVNLLDQHARNHPDAPAIICDNSPPLSYSELQAQTSSFAVRLGRQGIGQGERIAILLDNSPEFVIAFLGALRAGVVPTPLNIRLSSAEVAALMSDVDARLLIAREPRELDHKFATPVILAEEILELASSDVANANLAPVERQSADLANIMFTAGTSGSPKGVLHPHGMHVALGAGMAEYFHLSMDDVAMILSPMYHIGGLTVLATALFVGCPFVLEPNWERERVMASIDRHGVTFMHMITTVLLDIVNAEKSERSAFAADALRCVFTGGGPATSDQLRWFEERFSCWVSEGYGRTEGSKAWNPADPSRRPGSNGRPLETVARMRIVNETGAEQPIDVEGEIEVKGDGVALGYWKRPDLSREVFVADGWMRTGDKGRIDGDGFLHYLGRSDGMIKSGGENVYPKEVEDVLLSLLGVSEAAVVGVPDARLGEVVGAVIVADGWDAESIQQACREYLAGYKLPRRIRMVDRIPRLGSEKLDILKVRLLLAARDDLEVL